MPNCETFEGRALAYEQEQYDLVMVGMARAIAVLTKRRDETHDANVRYGLGIAIDTLKAEVRSL